MKKIACSVVAAVLAQVLMTGGSRALGGVSGPWICGNEHPEVCIVYGRDIDEVLSKLVDDKMTDRQKAIRIWKYVMTHIYHTPGLSEELRKPGDVSVGVFDAMKMLHCYGSAICGQNADMLSAIYRRSGLKAVTRNIGLHECCEVFYGGAWHYIDGDMGGYITDRQGRLVSGEFLAKLPKAERLAMHGNPVPAEDPHYTLDRFSRLWSGLGRQYRFTRGVCLHSMNFTLRPGESLTRWFDRQWGPDHQYAGLRHAHFRGRTYVRRSDPARLDQKTKADGYGIYSNGEFLYAPDLSQKSYAEGVASSRDVKSQRRSPRLAASRGGAEVVFEQRTPYVICGKPAEGTDVSKPGATGGAVVTGRAVGDVSLSVSRDMGATWKDFGKVSGDFRVDVTDHVKQRYQYLVRFRFAKGAGLDSLKLRTRVVLAAMQLPALEQGRNNMVYTSSGRSVVELTPDIWSSKAGYEALIHPLTKNAKWNDSKKAYVGAVNQRAPMELVYRLAATGAIRRIAAGGWVAPFGRKPDCVAQLQASADGGRTWQLLGEDTGSGTWYHAVQFEGDVKGGPKEVLVKLVTGARKTFPAAWRQIRIYGYYDDPSTSPVVITHAWAEGDRERTHVERVRAGAKRHTYAINVGSPLPPKRRRDRSSANRFIRMEVPVGAARR